MIQSSLGIAALTILFMGALSASIEVAASAEQSPVKDLAQKGLGKATYDRRCASCHAAGKEHPGTAMIGYKRGLQSAVLTDRSDLRAEYVKKIVRGGLLEMPPFRPTEISDVELAAVAQYLATGSHK
jgi:mono/diheme cytochrome c family protein